MKAMGTGSSVWLLIVAGSVLALLPLTGCQPSAKRIGPVRAIWVTRFDYKSADDVVRIINDCADGGFNTVLFQVRGNATAFYNSAFEPWDDALGGSDPGFDPLALACRQAHQRKVQLHAWVNVMPAWKGTKPPANPEQVYNKHPEWFWYDQTGVRQPLSSFYVSLNPCLPEVRAYLVDVFRDLAKKYPIDGLHMDYIRFPNEPPAIPKDSTIDYPRDAATLALYLKDTGLTPEADPEAWKQWRTAQVTQTVADIHAMLRRTKPKAVLSASVGSVPKSALAHFQDGRRWIADGIIDTVYLMNYTDTPETFEQRLEPWLAEDLGVPIVPGLWFGGTRKASPEEGIESVRRQIQIALARTGNVCVFAYSSLFDSRDQELATQDDKNRQLREQRRHALLPVGGTVRAAP